VAGGTVSRESEGGQIWWMYFIFLYENKIKKLFQEEGGKGRMMEG
jgi:hypothetical protein